LPILVKSEFTPLAKIKTPNKKEKDSSIEIEELMKTYQR
jgi:hypothetical protein